MTQMMAAHLELQLELEEQEQEPELAPSPGLELGLGLAPALEPRMEGLRLTCPVHRRDSVYCASPSNAALPQVLATS